MNVWTYAESANDFGPGSYANYAILHELGHALGLNHPDDNSDGVHGGFESSQQYTIMSCTALSGMGTDDITTSALPSGLQLLDIEAIQSIYGRNYETRRENTSYDKSGAFHTNHPDDAFVYTIWDGHGRDRIDVSGYNIGATVDLRQGKFSSVGYDAEGQDAAIGNLAIAAYTIIEDARGTDFNDTLIGNAWDNKLEGGNGDDHLHGDGLSYTDHNAGLLLWEAAGGTKYDTNGSGNDILIGGDGDDHFYGGIGADTFIGGDDNDTYYITEDGIADYIKDEGITGTDTINLSGTETGRNYSRIGNDLVVWSEPTQGERIVSTIIAGHFNGGRIEVIHYEDGDTNKDVTALGSSDLCALPAGFEAWLKEIQERFDLSFTRSSPLVLDLDGDGIELTSYSTNSATYFDLDETGFAMQTGWVGADDGLLAVDFDNSGNIQSSSELFGSSTVDGFTELKEFDSNQDGIINSNDAIWNDLIVWKDSNSDGNMQSDESFSMNDLHITYINLSAKHCPIQHKMATVSPTAVHMAMTLDQTLSRALSRTSGLLTIQSIHAMSAIMI